MWCTRIYKNDNTNKIEKLRLFDEGSGVFQEFTSSEVKKVLKVQPTIITNIRLDSYGKIKLLDMNNNRMKYHSKTYLADEIVAYHYLIIAGHRGGLLKVIADSLHADSIALNEVTLSTIIDRLKINVDVEHLKIYNGFVEKNNNKLDIFYYNGNNFTKIPSTTEYNQKQTLKHMIDNSIWNYEVDKVTSEGIYLTSIESIEGNASATLPEGILSLAEFGGGVNNLKLCKSLSSLGTRCFADLEDIVKITLPPLLKVIPNECFYQSSLQEISFSGYEEEIGEFAFADSSLKSSIITNARVIKQNAFEGVRSRVLKLPKIEKIYSEAFSLSKIEKIEFGETLKGIDTFAFSNCNRLYSVKFTSQVMINANAFINCPKLKEVRIPKGSKIHKNAFDKKCKIIFI